MTGKEYLETQMALIELGKQIDRLDLPEFIQSIEKAESMAPILDPTLFRKAQNNLAAMKALARKFWEVKMEFIATRGTIMETLSNEPI